jgi:hypothetical protein
MPNICSIESCSNLARTNGWCSKHYQRWKIHGDPNKLLIFKDIPLADRLLLSKVIVLSNYETPCWEYTGLLDKDGYGRITFEGEGYKVHRASYLEFVGEIPEGLFVCHKCDNPKCFNPNHLFLGTLQDNTSDMLEKGRSAKGSDNAKARLTEEQVRYILNYDVKYGDKAKLAIKFNVTPRIIGLILKREIWKHI